MLVKVLCFVWCVFSGRYTVVSSCMFCRLREYVWFGFVTTTFSSRSVRAPGLWKNSATELAG